MRRVVKEGGGMPENERIRPWITERAFTSPWTYEANQHLKLPSKVTVYDVTLRDGEQYPGLVLRKEQKVLLAQALDDLGISRLEAGMPAVSPEDEEAVREIVKAVGADVVAFCRAMRSDVDLAANAGVWGVIVELPANRSLIESGYNWSVSEVIEKAIDVCNYAKRKCLHVTFFMIDASGADPDFLENLVRRVVAETDLDSLTAVDTFGRLHPRGTEAFVRALKTWSGGKTIEIHVHNDFGLGTANSLAAVEAGAEVVHTNVLGLGERSGGTPTEEVAAALEFVYGIPTGIRLSELTRTARLFEEITHVSMPGHKPVVGLNSFSYEAGIAAMFSYRMHNLGLPLGTVPYLPELVGGRFRIVLGKKAGRYNVLWHLDRAARSASDEAVRQIVDRVKAMGTEKGRAITTPEFEGICREVEKKGE
jgi:methanogen homocitrate synthase